MRKQAVFLLFLLPLCAFAAEREVSTPAAGPVTGTRHSLQAAASARAVLAVWRDWRVPFAEEGYGMLVDHDGGPLVERSFFIGKGISAVASDGRDFLAGGSETGRTLSFVRVRENGAVEPLPARIAINGGGLFLGFTGGHYVALHRTMKGRLAATILNAAGEVVRDSVIITSDPLTTEIVAERMAVDGAGGVYILWTRADDRRLHGEVFTIARLLDPSFRPVATEPIAGPAVFPIDFSIAWNGSEYLVAWQLRDAQMNAQLLLRRVDRNGQGIGNVITLPSGYYHPRIAWTGANWLFARYPEREQAVRVSASGTVLDANPLRLPPAADMFDDAVAVSGGAWVGWRRGWPSPAQPNEQFEGDVIRADGSRRRPAAGVLLSAGSPAQLAPSLAACGDSTFAATWRESTDREFLRYARFSVEGQLAGPIATVRETPSSGQVACTGSSAVVMWSEGGKVFTSAVGQDHFPLPPVEIGTGFAGDIAWNGEHYVATWSQQQSLMLALLDRNGRAASPGVPMRELPAGSPHRRDEWSAVAVRGNESFIAWLMATYVATPGFGVFNNSYFHDIRTIVLGSSLTRRSALTEMEQGRFPSVSGLTHGLPSVAAGPPGYLMAWSQSVQKGRPGAWVTTTRFARFDANGTLLDDPKGVSIGRSDRQPHAAWNGSAWEIACGDQLYTVAPDGTFTARKVLDSGEAAARAYDGTRPLMLVTRRHPVDGVPRLWVGTR